MRSRYAGEAADAPSSSHARHDDATHAVLMHYPVKLVDLASYGARAGAQLERLLFRLHPLEHASSSHEQFMPGGCACAALVEVRAKTRGNPASAARARRGSEMSQVHARHNLTLARSVCLSREAHSRA